MADETDFPVAFVHLVAAAVAVSTSKTKGNSALPPLSFCIAKGSEWLSPLKSHPTPSLSAFRCLQWGKSTESPRKAGWGGGGKAGDKRWAISAYLELAEERARSCILSFAYFRFSIVTGIFRGAAVLEGGGAREQELKWFISCPLGSLQSEPVAYYFYLNSCWSRAWKLLFQFTLDWEPIFFISNHNPFFFTKMYCSQFFSPKMLNCHFFCYFPVICF